MKTIFWKNSLLSVLILICKVNILQGQTPQYDLRFVPQITSCLTEEIFVDVEIKASTPASIFGLGIQNYRFNFNTTTVPPINPPIGPPNTNPPDRSVFINQELTVSGSVASSLYDTHTLTGSSGNLVSYNVTLLAGPGYPITFDNWVSIGRLRMDMADPMPPCLNLTWDVGSTLIITGAFMVATPGTLNDITICGICQTLPIELARFDVKESECEAVLEWETLTETNNSHFIIERSQDGESFEIVGEVEGSGTSSSLNQYQFTDRLIHAENYYRLRQVDQDGESFISEIKYFKSSCFNDTEAIGLISVYPNPVSASGKIEVFINSPEQVTGFLEVSDAKGQTIETFNLDLSKGQNRLPVHLESYSSGLYFLRFLSPSWQSDSVKLILSK